MSEDYTLRGAPIPEAPNLSIGEYILPRLKSLPKDYVLLVDSETGVTQTSRDFLTKGVQLLEGLKRLGLQENDIIGMLCKSGFEANWIVLASWLGAASLAPINGYMKEGELKHVFQLIKPKYIICEEGMLDNVIPASKVLQENTTIILLHKSQNSPHPYQCLSELFVEADVENFQAKSIKSPATQIAIIPPSSGTSGLPKGIAISHKSLIFQNMLMDELEVFDKKGIFLQLSHFYWVTAILMFLRTVCVGTKRVFMKNINHENTLKAIEKYKPTFTIMAPLTLLGFTQHSDFKKYDLSSIKYILVGGSTLTESIERKVHEVWPELKMYNGYGLTETSGVISLNNSGDLSVGTVNPGMIIKFVDTNTGETLKPNTPGEICVKSPGVMIGYYGNEEATKESIDKEGWLHSGDIGYYDETGTIYIVDRIKEMVKVRDMQVAPVEIENVILTVPGVLEVGVVGVPHERDIFHLMAFVVSNRNFKEVEENIHAYVKNNLSEYKALTAGIRFVDSIPKTSSGKMDRKKLRVMALKPKT